MPVTLRKRPAPAEPPAAAPPAKKKSAVAKTVAKVKETVKKAAAPKAAPKATKAKATTTKAAEPKQTAKTNGAKEKEKEKEKDVAPAPAPVPEKEKVVPKIEVGETIDLEGFGSEIETNDGEKTTLKKLVDESKNGVVLFTYPKASTPGCTNQVCFFRDSYTPLTSTGYSIYGLSKDTPKNNTTFSTKNKLPYTLLCDTSSSLIKAIGFKKAPNSTVRGVFVIDKSGKILAAEAGSPKGTMEVVERLVGQGAGDVPEEEPEVEVAKDTKTTEAEPVAGKEAMTEEEKEKTETEKKEKTTEGAAAPVPETNGVNGTNGTSKDETEADVAAEVADTAEKLDSNEEAAKPAEA